MRLFPSISLLKAAPLWLAGLAIVFTSCSKSEEFEYIDDPTSGGSKTTIIVTDEEGKTGTLEAGAIIGVYVIDENGNVTLTQAKVDKDGNAVLPTLAGGSTMVAYQPFQPSWGTSALSGSPEFSVSSDQSSQKDYDASDLIIGTATTTRASMEGLTFRHMLAKVAIHVVDETGQADLKSLHVKLMDVCTSVNVDLLHAAVSTSSGTRSDIQMISEMTTDWRLSAYAIIAPQDVSEGRTFFTVTMKGVKLRYPIPQASTLESGKTYTINMRLTDEGLIPDGNYVTDWDDKGEDSLIL